MRQFVRLTAVQLRGLLSSGRRRRGRRARSWSTAAVFALVIGLTFLISLLYSVTLAFALAPEGAADLVLSLIPALGLGVAIGMGSQSAGSFVFGGKDNDLLLSLPIPPTMLGASKLTALFAENLMILVGVAVPAGIAYALVAPTAVYFWPVLVGSAALLAGLATAASTLLGMLLTWVARGQGHKLLANTLAMGLMAGFVALWFLGQTALRDRLRDDPGSLRHGIAQWLPPLEWLRAAAVEGSLPAFGLLLLAGTVPFAVVAWLVGRSFIPLVSALTARGGGARRVDLARLRSRPALVSLVRREAKRYFGTTIYFVNTGFALMIVLLAAGYLLVTRALPPGVDVVCQVTNTSPALLAVVGLTGILSVAPITAPSIALEGDRLWILKTAPLPARTILDAKVAFSLLLTAPVVALAAVAVALVAHSTPVEALLALLTPLAFATASAVLGLTASLNWPRLDAPNDTVAVKQGPAVVLSMLGGMALTVVVAVLGFTVAGRAGPVAGLAAMFALGVALAAGSYAALRTWGVRTFAELE